MEYTTVQNGAGFKRSIFGWNVVAAARINTIGKDSVLVGAIYGIGDARDQGNTPGEEIEVNTATGSTRALAEYGGWIGYLHYWTDTLRSSATLSMEHSNPTNDLGFSAAAFNKYQAWHTANLIWSPVPQVDTGIELIYTSHKTMSTNPNTNFAEIYRLQYSTKVKF